MLENIVKAYSRGCWINNWIERRAQHTPNWLALIDDATGEDRRLSFKDFNDRVNRVASALRDTLNLRKGDRVAMLSWARIEVLEALFASSKLGCVFTPLNTRHTAREIARFLSEVKPKVLIYESEFSGVVKELAGNVGIESLINIGGEGVEGSISWSSLYDSPPLDKPVEVGIEDPLMILQTGGTTGRPKAAVVPYRMIFWNALNTIRDLIIPGDLTITALPLFHIGGYTYVIPLLMFGGANFIMHRWDVDKFIDYVERERPSFLFLVPTQLKMLLDNPRFSKADFSSVRWITSGGAALTREIIRGIFRKGITMKQGFGMTEMGPGVFALDPWDAHRKMGSIGLPNLLVEAKVVREDGRIAGAGEEGELLLRSPSIFGGYLTMAEETAKAVRDGWLHTGDIVKRDDEGFFWVVGRSKNVIRSGAESIYPEEVEKVLLEHPAVVEAVVIGVRDEKWGEVPKALIVLREGARITKDELVEFCMGKIAKYKIPKYIQVVKAIPKTDVGKVSRRKLVELFGEPRDEIGD